ncbi:hypothetical protein CWC20_07545 [Pseudoalteromonas aurantia]|uniref:Uncharacterized protein n=1 Tax=Pseudoalteromonas aurantia TaxID=43654 RepID=A0ABY2VZI7_9GAMM|nr:hypothetical protein CWC20_07545 [Pseudoalteromonas aurantia]
MVLVPVFGVVPDLRQEDGVWGLLRGANLRWILTFVREAKLGRETKVGSGVQKQGGGITCP